MVMPLRLWIWWLAVTAGSVELALADPLTHDSLVASLREFGFVTGSVQMFEGKPYRLERVKVRSKGDGEFTIEFKAIPQ